MWNIESIDFTNAEAIVDTSDANMEIVFNSCEEIVEIEAVKVVRADGTVVLKEKHSVGRGEKKIPLVYGDVIRVDSIYPDRWYYGDNKYKILR